MQVQQAVAERRSARAFRSDPVSQCEVRELLELAGQAPSGGNLQPWHVRALTGERLAALVSLVAEQGPDAEPGYPIYPDALKEPYRTRRFQVGEELYRTIGVAREDKAGRLRQLARNGAFFGAPVGIFVFIDRQMGPPQWSDLGMFVQTLLLLAHERGLATCAQEYWTLHAAAVERFLEVPQELMLFCGIALGHADLEAPINALRSGRAPFEEWCKLEGFA